MPAHYGFSSVRSAVTSIVRPSSLTPEEPKHADPELAHDLGPGSSVLSLGSLTCVSVPL